MGVKIFRSRAELSDDVICHVNEFVPLQMTFTDTSPTFHKLLERKFDSDQLLMKDLGLEM